jgi:hypothetical protein
VTAIRTAILAAMLCLTTAARRLFRGEQRIDDSV